MTNNSENGSLLKKRQAIVDERVGNSTGFPINVLPQYAAISLFKQIESLKLQPQGLEASDIDQ